jgi:hypothetical protein
MPKLVNQQQIQLIWDLFSHCHEYLPITTVQEDSSNIICAILTATIEISKLFNK